MKKHILAITFNFSAILLLAALIIAPIYFAKNFTQVAGVKSESPYLLVSQTEKFPGMTFSQSASTYTIAFTKQASSQAYLSIFIINNPTNEPKSYTIQNQSSENKFFFGEDLNSLQNKINVPAQVSVPISVLSHSTSDKQTATFQIQVD